jgi:hypothetical protein
MGNWYTFGSQEAFDTWHDLVKFQLGIPYANKNFATGKIDKKAQWTTAFVEPIVVAEEDLRIYLLDEYAETYSQELGELSTSPYDLGPRLEI